MKSSTATKPNDPRRFRLARVLRAIERAEMSDKKLIRVGAFPRVHASARNHPEIKALFASPQYPEILRLLEGKPLGPSFRNGTLEDVVVEAALFVRFPPTYSERLTQGERKKIANRIIKAARELGDAMMPLMGKDNIFQPDFDALALDIAVEEAEDLKEAGIVLDEDTFNRCRMAAYRLMMDGIPELLASISGSAEHYAERKSILKQPNDANADRLYFIRKVTKFFGLAFNSPMRAATLALTSVYFDCGGLTEASLSVIAPDWKRKPFVLPPEAVEQMKSFAKEHSFDFEQLEEAKRQAKEFYGKKKNRLAKGKKTE